MLRNKKMLSTLLAVLLIFGVFSVVAYAYTENAVFELSADKTTALAANDTVKLTVSLKTDYYVASSNIPVYYDSSKLSVESVAFAGWVAKPANTDSAYNSAVAGVVWLSFSVKSTAVPVKFAGEQIAVITFKAKAAASGKLVYMNGDEQRTESRPNNDFIVGSYPSADANSAARAFGQNFYFSTKAAVAFGTAADTVSIIMSKTAKTLATNGSKCDFRIISKFSQADAAEYFAIPANKVAAGYLGKQGIVTAGTLVAKQSVVDAKSSKTLTLSDVNNKTVFNAESKYLYTDEANTKGTGYYYFAATIKNIPAANWDTPLYAIGYVTYKNGSTTKTVYTQGNTIVISVEPAA